MIDFESARKRMVKDQIRARGIRSPRVLSAFASVPREVFVPDVNRENSYADTPLPIGAGQTISQPYIVAFMVEALALGGGEKALEIGSGSGYAAAILAQLCKEVFAIERIEALALQSEKTLRSVGIANVRVRHDDGSEGWPEEAPFDAILVSAGARQIPEPLESQLAIGGRMVLPVGPSPQAQELIRVTRLSENDFTRETIGAVRFVPLIGSVE